MQVHLILDDADKTEFDLLLMFHFFFSIFSTIGSATAALVCIL
ncbi:hypothetical protein RUMOBE_00496 [Blautia obeum ATCC 29174]|uniref:Uncharacterized protein n=1 Tax=Blautia obeum ATCC 29174 TaxID=411459 RepID=A5ZNC9_9FIRM|nr:hypothetical protein RUMOBE_00496 [Blautia obeum ATCC 29174]